MIPEIVSRRRCVCSLSAILLLVCIGACGASSTSHTSDYGRTLPSLPKTSSSVRDPQASRVVAKVEHQQLANFALLRTPPEGLPTAVRRILKAPVFGSNWNLAQRIPVTISGAYWLLPGDGYLCVVSEGSMGSPTVGTTCARASQARQHGIAAITVVRAVPGSHVAAGRLIVGLAPDSAHQVVVHTAGSAETVPVLDEVFVLHDSIVAPPDFFVLR
jgi:hypothetical protein